MAEQYRQQDSQWSSFQMTYPTAPDTAEALSDWSAASGGRFQFLNGYTTTTPPIVPPSSAAEIVDPAGTYSGAGASAPSWRRRARISRSRGDLRRGGICRPCRHIQPAGASAPIADPGAPTARRRERANDGPGRHVQQSVRARSLLLVVDNTAPTSSVLSFQSATAVANYFGATSDEASLANEFFAGYGAAPATMLISRYSF